MPQSTIINVIKPCPDRFDNKQGLLRLPPEVHGLIFKILDTSENCRSLASTCTLLRAWKSLGWRQVDVTPMDTHHARVRQLERLLDVVMSTAYIQLAITDVRVHPVPLLHDLWQSTRVLSTPLKRLHEQIDESLCRLLSTCPNISTFVGQTSFSFPLGPAIRPTSTNFQALPSLRTLCLKLLNMEPSAMPQTTQLEKLVISQALNASVPFIVHQTNLKILHVPHRLFFRCLQSVLPELPLLEELVAAADVGRLDWLLVLQSTLVSSIEGTRITTEKFVAPRLPA